MNTFLFIGLVINFVFTLISFIDIRVKVIKLLKLHVGSTPNSGCVPGMFGIFYFVFNIYLFWTEYFWVGISLMLITLITSSYIKPIAFKYNAQPLEIYVDDATSYYITDNIFGLLLIGYAVIEIIKNTPV